MFMSFLQIEIGFFLLNTWVKNNIILFIVKEDKPPLLFIEENCAKEKNIYIIDHTHLCDKCHYAQECQNQRLWETKRDIRISCFQSHTSKDTCN